MEQELQLLKARVEELESRNLTSRDNKYIDIDNIENLFDVITNTTDLGKITSSNANNLYEQIKIYNDNTTKKLYVYDFRHNVWLSATLT